MIGALLDRSNYASLKECVYLNQASLGLVGEPAVTAMHSFLDDIARHGNWKMSDGEEVAFFNALRTPAATILNCAPEQLAILSSASELLSQLPFLFRPAKGSIIVVVSTDFPAVTRPFIGYALEHGCQLRFVDDRASEDLTSAIIESMDESTSVVAVSYVQFSTGTMVDIHRLRDATAAVGARLVVDVTQAAGAIPVDTRAWNADVVVCSGYKWLGGHGGMALAVLAPELLKVDPPSAGWMGAPSPFEFDATTSLFEKDARRYTQSTLSYLSLVGLRVAIEHLLLLAPEDFEPHARSLGNLLLDDIASDGWQPFRPIDDRAAAPHIVALSHTRTNAESAVQTLRARNIICGNRNNRLRVSLAPYNDEHDIRAVTDALRANP